MFLCLPYPCISSHIPSNTRVQFATSPSPVRGCFKVTCDHTRGRNRTDARTAAKRLQIAPTCARTCKRTLRSRAITVRDAINHSHSNPTSISTTRVRVYATRQTVQVWHQVVSCDRQQDRQFTFFTFHYHRKPKYTNCSLSLLHSRGMTSSEL